MAQERPAPSEALQTSFMAKLGDFRNGLSGDEQTMLDTLVEAALFGKGGDVEAYEWVWEPGPGWHRAWNDTPWGWRWHWAP